MRKTAFRYSPCSKPGGILVLEKDLVKQPPTKQCLGLPYTALARDKVGIVQAMNTVVLGSLSFLLPFVQQAVMRKSLESVLPAKIIDKQNDVDIGPDGRHPFFQVFKMDVTKPLGKFQHLVRRRSSTGQAGRGTLAARYRPYAVFAGRTNDRPAL